jgi:hypothetical protein
MTVELGAAAARGTVAVNRSAKSAGDVTEPGSVYGNDRIGDDAIDSAQLVDSAVIESKLDDLAVTLNKVDFDAIDETKIQDDAVTTPKLVANAVIAAKIAADTITANEIAAGTITALEIAADTLTANEIDTLDLDTQQLFIGTDTTTGLEFEVDLSNDWVKMLPSSTGAFCVIGESGREIASVNTQSTSATNFVGAGTDTKTTASSSLEVLAQGATERIIFQEDSNETEIVPESDGVGQVGDPFLAFREMNAESFNTQSAPSFAGDACRDLSAADYGAKDLPKWVLPDAPDDDVLATDRDANGDRISLGRMCSWLLSICQSQEERLEKMDKRLSRLEAQQ